MSRPSDDELIAAAIAVVRDLRAMDRRINRNFWIVALAFGIPFFVYTAPMIYHALGLTDTSGLTVALAIITICFLGVTLWRRAH